MHVGNLEREEQNPIKKVCKQLQRVPESYTKVTTFNAFYTSLMSALPPEPKNRRLLEISNDGLKARIMVKSIPLRNKVIKASYILLLDEN